MFRRGLFYSYLSIYLRFFLGLSVTETTLFGTVPMILNILFQTFVWGVISDRFQLRRTLVILGEILAGLGTLVVWYAHTLVNNYFLAGYVIILGLSIVEIFWSMSNVGWSSLISDIYPVEDRNSVQGKLMGIGGLGRILGAFLGGLLYDGFQLQYEGWGFYEGSLFIVAAIIMLVSTVPMFFIPEGGITGEKSQLEVASDLEMKKRNSTSRIFAIFIIAMVFINFGRNSIAIIMSQYLVLDSGFNVSSVTLSFIVNTHSVAVIIFGFLAGWISHKIGNARTLVFGTVISVAGLLLIGLASDLILVFAGSFLRGTSEVIIVSSSYAFASILIPPKNRAKLFGVFNATLFLSWGIPGTFLAGPVTDILLGIGVSEVAAYQMAFLLGAGVIVIGLAILGALLLFKKVEITEEENNAKNSPN